MIYPPVRALQALARFQHLDPGDLLLTGTPVGTALSAPAKPVAFLGSLLPPARKWKIFLGRQRKQPAATCRTATSSRPPIDHRRRRASTSARSAPPCDGPDDAPSRDRHELLWPALRHPGRPGRDRGRAAAGPRPARDHLRAAAPRAATLWPDRVAVSVLPDAERWQRAACGAPSRELLADVHRYANLLHELGVRRGDAVALMAPNCAELITATLAAQLAGHRRAAQRRRSYRAHLAELLRPLRRPGARHRRTRARAGHLGAPRRALAARRQCSTPSWSLRPTAAAGPPAAAAVAAPAPASRVALPRRAGRRARDPSRFAGDRRPARPTWRRCSTPAAPPARRSWPRTPTPTRWPTPGCWPPTPVFDARLDGVRRAAAVPRQRARRHPAGAAVQGPAGGVGRAARLPRPRPVRRSSGSSSSTTGSPR